jgi:putative tricarboxylic transport membrane protein
MADTDIPHSTPKPRSDIAAGLVFIAIAALFGWRSTSYEMGRLIAMGPGFVPLSLSILLGALGVGIALFGRSGGDEAAGAVPWRGIVLVCAALLLFGTYCRDLGLLPVVFLCAFMTALASPRNSIVSATWIAGALALLCWLVFKVGLGLALPLVGPVFGPLQVY